ncbi:MAG: hypothetical protein PVG82_06365 [Chromatiales bacterium]|jgi:uncharacterized protein (DUF2336 family)
MNADDEIRQLLIEIRDNQRIGLERQEEQLRIAREQLERARSQVAESIELQRQAVDRFKTVSRIAIPGIVLCVVLIVYLTARYL